MSFILSRRGVLMATTAAPPPPPPELEPVRWDTDFVPANYTLSQDNTAYVQSGASNYQRWLQSDKILGLYDENSQPYRWYWEVELTAGASSMDGYTGVVSEGDWGNWNASSNPLGAGSLGYRGNGNMWGNGAVQINTLPATYGSGDVIMFVFEPVTGEMWVGKNGTWARNPSTQAAVATSSTPGADFKLSGQGRGNGDAGILRSLVEDFDYAVPDGCTPISEPNYAAPILDGVLAEDLTMFSIVGRSPASVNAQDLTAFVISGRSPASVNTQGITLFVIVEP